MAPGQDMVGFGDKLLPLTGTAGGARTAATSSITLTCGTEASPPERGSRSDGWVNERFTLRVVTCRNSAAASTRANSSACAKEALSSGPIFCRGGRLGALGWQHMDALTPRVSMAEPPVRSAMVDQALLWAFIAGLAWCPFWFGSNVLLAWGVNAVLFPGLVIIYELSLLIRGERHPVGIQHIKIPAALFGAVVLWIL